MLGILCSGQGGQHAGMLDILADDPAARPVIDRAGALLGLDLWQKVRAGGDALVANALAQPLLCAYQMAAWQALRPGLPRPRVFAGYSVGEVAAYGCAGALAPDGLIALARSRAAAMDRACPRPNGLLAVRGLRRAAVEALCRSTGCAVAIVNGVDRMVVGGVRDGLARFEALAAREGAGLTPIAVTVASHTPLMAPGRAAFDAALDAHGLRAPAVPVLSGVDGAPVTTASRARESLSRQLTETVEWAACMDGLVEMGCTTLLELGPCDALARMIRERRPGVAVRSLAEFKSIAGAVGWVTRQ